MTYTGDECGNPQCKELFDVAIKEFADKGYASVKLSDIATRARIESCIMASRFSGKKELYVAAAENIFREYFALADSQSSLIKALLILMRRIRAGRAGVTSSSAGVKFIAGLFEDTEVNKLVWKRIGSEFEKTRLFGMMRSAVSREIMVDGHPFVLLMTLLHRLVVDGASISDAGIAVFKDSAYLRLLAVSTELDDAGIYYADAQDEVDDMIRRIASFYTGIYIVDFDKEELYPFLINPNAICYGPFRESIPYDEVNKIYVANCVHPLDRTEMTNLYANLRRKLETNRNISTNYRRLYGEEYLYTELNITRLDDSEGPPKKALMAYIEKDEQIKLGHGKEEIVRQGIEILYSIEDTEKALSELVKAIGEYHKADSAYIFEYNRGRTVLRMSHEWRAEGAPGQESVGMEVPLSEVEKWIVTLDVNNGLILDNLENPSGDNAFSGRLISNKVERMMVVPLSTEEYATGFVAVDNSRYSHGNLLALRAMAAIANSEILRRNQTARDQFVINKLIGSFYFIYFVDLNSDYIKPYVMSASHREKCANPKNYTSIIKAFIGDSAYKSDRGKFNSIANPEYVRSRLMSKESFSMPFTEVADGLIRSMELRFIRIDDSGSQFVMCCIDNTEAIEHQKRLQRVVQNQLKFLVADRTAELQDKNRMLNRMSEDMIDLLGEVTESRDIESGEHIKRVKTFTGILARQMMKDWPEYGLDEEQIGIMVSVSPLHDIGKIAIPDRILLKPGPLTAEEFNLMKTHCEKGCEILKKAPMEWPESYFNMSLDICMYHHERHNGKGYPMGLVGDEIPISAQIVSIADCFDALTSKRVYKAAYTPEKAYDMMQGGECGVFSPKLLKSLENCKNAMFACAGSGRQETGHFAASYDTIPGLEGIRVLLVDNEYNYRHLCFGLLQGEGADITSVESGEEAVALLGSSMGDFDVLVIGPAVSGAEAAEIAADIRALTVSEADCLPIIVLLSEAPPELVENCYSNGVSFCVTDAISVVSVIRALHSGSPPLREMQDVGKEKSASIAEENKLFGLCDFSIYTEMVACFTSAIKNDPESAHFAVIFCKMFFDDGESPHAMLERPKKSEDLIASVSQIFRHSPVFRTCCEEFVLMIGGMDYYERDRLKSDLAALRDSINDLSDSGYIFSFGMAEYIPGYDNGVAMVLDRAQEIMLRNHASPSSTPPRTNRLMRTRTKDTLR